MSNSYDIKQTLCHFGIQLPNKVISVDSAQMHNDSRVLSQGDIFCAVIGTLADGRKYITQALNRNVSLILSECESAAHHGHIHWLENANGQAVAQVSFYQLNQQLFNLASLYYHQPQNGFTIVGITGTNGKTSTSQIIAKLLSLSEKRCAVIGTNGAGLVDNLTPIDNTTPGATELLQFLVKFKASNITHLAMEISSHALEQKRVHAALLDVAVFTNLSRDHLDYHQTMDNYADAKYQIFSHNEQQVAVINGDDLYAKQWLNNWPSKQPVVVYGRGEEIALFPAYVQATDVVHSPQGVSFTLHSHLGQVDIKSALFGDFNVDNLLAAIAVLLTQNITLNEIAQLVTQLSPVLGRMESFNQANLATAIVDYAHTPDALENALIACRQHCQGKLWVVFGCGGNRDKGKRPLMGQIAEQLADKVIVTNDNPRNEEPQSIIQDILLGCEQSDAIIVELDRQQAVMSALANAQADDVVLLAGKGHEDYVIIGDEKVSYNERELVRQYYQSEAIS